MCAPRITKKEHKNNEIVSTYIVTVFDLKKINQRLIKLTLSSHPSLVHHLSFVFLPQKLAGNHHSSGDESHYFYHHHHHHYPCPLLQCPQFPSSLSPTQNSPFLHSDLSLSLPLLLLLFLVLRFPNAPMDSVATKSSPYSPAPLRRL